MAERKVTFLINANVRNFTKGMDSASKRFQRFGRDMERMGRSMTRNITAPLLAAAGGVTKMASDFESSMTKIETLVGLSRAQVQGMQKDVLNLAREAGKAPLELSEALFTVTSAGLRGAEAMSVLERAAKASAIGLGDAKSIAQATTGVMQAYAKQGLSAAQATDTLTAIVREGNLEASELAPVLGRVVGIASQLGVSFQEVGASIATFTRLGVSAEEAVTGLRGIMNGLVKVTPQSRQAFKELGTSIEEVRERISGGEGLARVLVDLIKANDGNLDSLGKLIPNVRALSAVLGTAGAQGASYVQILDNINNATGIVDDGFARVSETAQFKFNKALSSLKVSAIGLGTILLPVFTKMINVVQNLADRFSRVSTEAQIFGLKVAGIAILIGPTLLLIGKLSTVIGLLVAPAFLAKAAIVGLFVGVVTSGQWLIDNFGKIDQGFRNVMMSMEIAALKMANGVIGAISSVIEFVINRTPHGIMAGLFGFNPGEAAVDFVGITGLIDDTNKKIEEKTGELVNGISSYNSQVWGSFSDSAKHALELAKNTIINGLQGIVDSSIIQGLLDKMNGLMTPSGGGGGSTVATPTREGSPIGTRSLPTSNRMQEISQGFLRNAEGANKFSGALQDVSIFAGAAMDIANNFTNSFGQGMANVIVQGEKLVDTLKNIGKLLASAVIQKGLQVLLMGGLGGTGLFGSGGGLFGQIFGVNDALITSGGDVVKFHPDDNILAMKDFSNLNTGSSQPVRVYGVLKGTDIHISSNRGGTSFGR